MFFKKEKEDDLDKRLKEIEERVKGLKDSQLKATNVEAKDTSIEQKINEETNQKKIEEKTEKEDFNVPLFVKLDKYRSIVSTLMQLKTYLITLKNSLIAIEQIEKARIETLNTLSKTLEKMNEKINELEKNLVKPIGFTFGSPETIEELSNVQTTLSNLKSQIEELKAELEGG